MSDFFGRHVDHQHSKANLIEGVKGFTVTGQGHIANVAVSIIMGGGFHRRAAFGTINRPGGCARYQVEHKNFVGLPASNIN